MVCADTSFLISFYGDDVKSELARDYHSASSLPFHIHALNDFELANALRALVFRGKITPDQRRDWLADYEEDKRAGFLRMIEIDANATFQLANDMSAKWTETGGYRGFDILLIAASKLLGATRFWSFDHRQRDLATAEGLVVGP